MPARYFDLIREMKQNTYNHRLRLVESAQERGIKPTARLFATTVPTVRKWLRRFEQNGPSGLIGQSRARHRQPHKTPPHREAQFVQLRKTLPTFGARRLIREFALPISHGALERIWRQHGLIRKRRRKYQRDTPSTMEPREQPGYVSPPAKVVAFVRDFVPQQMAKLLFPLGSLLLLLGASNFWFKIELPYIPESYLSQVSHNTAAFEHLTRAITMWVSLEEKFAHLLVRVGFLASLVLWTLNVREPLKKFIYWVVLPTGAAVIGYTAYFVATADERHAFINAFMAAINFPPAKYSRLPSASEGLYLTLAGLVVLILGIALVRDGLIKIPLRFHKNAENDPILETEVSRDGRDIFVLLIGAVLIFNWKSKGMRRISALSLRAV